MSIYSYVVEQVRATSRSSRRRLWAERIAVATLFFCNGALLATWVSRIPAVQQHLRLGTGALGVALLGVGVGSVVAMVLTGWMAERWGTSRVLAAGMAAMCLALPLAALAPTLPTLFAALAILGAGTGAMDVTMNAEAVAVERRWGAPILSSFHAFWSFGAMAGAAAGSALARQNVAVATHLGGAVAVLAIIAVPAVLRLPALGAPPSEGGGGAAAGERPPILVLPPPALLGLGAVALCSFLAEGAMADWSAVFLHDVQHTGMGPAAAGYAVFAGAMAVGRLVGDLFVRRVGAVRALRAGGGLAGAALFALLAIDQPAATFIGFAAIGVGLSIVVPVAFSAAGNAPGMSSARAIAAVATAGYSGILAGPPAIGFVAEAITLRGALGLVALLCLTIACLAGSARSAARSPE